MGEANVRFPFRDADGNLEYRSFIIDTDDSDTLATVCGRAEIIAQNYIDQNTPGTFGLAKGGVGLTFVERGGQAICEVVDWTS